MKNRNLLVGLFVIAGLALFTICLFLIGNRHEAFSRHIEYYSDFTNLSGLTAGSKVQVGGMDAGEILAIEVPSSPASRFRVRIRINDALQGLVRVDSLTTIATEGVVGDTFLLIQPGSAQSPAAPSLSTLPSKEPIDISKMLDEGQSVLSNVNRTVTNANGVISSLGGSVGSALNGVQTTVANVNDVVVDLKHGRGAAGMLLQDPAFQGQIRQTIQNAQDATDSLKKAADQANAMVTDINSRQMPKKIDETLSIVKSAAANADSTSQQLRQTVAEATGPDEQGVTAGVNLRESLSNTNATISNVEDETEALKHNFLLRGFFRRRGYFNLQQISPDKYRKDPLFTSSSNKRVWLSGSQLFITDPAGLEQLTVQGKKLLDDAVGKDADSFVESPIVIEGYRSATNAADELAISRGRAIAIRRYLQNHFLLDASHLGYVALEDLATKRPGSHIVGWSVHCSIATETVAIFSPRRFSK